MGPDEGQPRRGPPVPRRARGRAPPRLARPRRLKLSGRGAARNPTGRFEPLTRLPDPDPGLRFDPDADPAPRTVFLRDAAKSIVNAIESPDLGIEASVNPYRGCEHGCAYCYARPLHEYLGFSAGLDFETKILVKERAPDLLHRELSAKGWRPRTIALSGATDPYQPVERRLRLTREILGVLRDFRNPVGIITKNALVTRDADVLAELAGHGAAAVYLSITTLDRELQRVLEPRTSPPQGRLEAIRTLANAGIPVGVMVAPVIPALTDHELPAILEAAANAGARFAGMVVLRLPHGVADLFTDWLRAHRPLRADKVLHRIREIRGGALNDPKFGTRMTGEGEFARSIEQLFSLGCRRGRLATRGPELRTDGFRVPPKPGDQLPLFSP